MLLSFLGCGAAFNPLLGSTSAYCREGRTLLLLDCGESVFRELISRDLLTDLDRVILALSHTHSDHCGSLGSLGHYCHYKLHIPLFLVVPEDEAFRADLLCLLRLFGVPADTVSFLPCGPLPGLSAVSSLTLVPTRHAADLSCYSFAMETPAGGVFFSADTCTADTALAFIAAHPRFEAVYLDATDADYPGNIHLPLRLLCEAFPPSLRSRIHLMHFNAPSCIEAARSLGFSLVSC